jgi:hypothetical protein
MGDASWDAARRGEARRADIDEASRGLAVEDKRKREREREGEGEGPVHESALEASPPRAGRSTVSLTK